MRYAWLLLLAGCAATAPRVLALAPAAGRLLVVPGTIAGRHANFTVGPCTGYEMTASRRPAAATTEVA